MRLFCKKSAKPTFSEPGDDFEDLDDLEEGVEPSASLSASSISFVKTVSIN